MASKAAAGSTPTAAAVERPVVISRSQSAGAFAVPAPGPVLKRTPVRKPLPADLKPTPSPIVPSPSPSPALFSADAYVTRADLAAVAYNSTAPLGFLHTSCGATAGLLDMKMECRRNRAHRRLGQRFEFSLDSAPGLAVYVGLELQGLPSQAPQPPPPDEAAQL